ncbi:UNVERIFIED_CONTAM: 4-hydroxy-tetrahydrodipicolinate reductase [Spiribacter pallidus]
MGVRVGILGAGGRMGRTLVQLVAESKDLALGAATVEPGSPWVGCDAGELAGAGQAGVAVVDDPMAAAQAADVLVDFTLPAALPGNLAAVEATTTPIVIGTTGLDSDDVARLDAVAARVPLVQAANYSSGVTLMRHLARVAAGALGDDYDIEIVEAHHRHKQDAPSGTARALGESVAAGRGVALEDRAVYARHGITGARPRGEIGFQTLRGGDIVGEHTVLFAGEGERLELTHRASSRAVFARGALRAAHWVKDQPPGRYDMEDVLGLRG